MPGIGTRNAASGVTLVTTAETVAIAIPFSGGAAMNRSAANPLSGNSADNRITGEMNVTAGAGTTTVQLRCRQGGLTGPQVSTTRTVTLPAATTDDIPFEFGDLGGSVAQAYVVTVQQVGATGNGTVNVVTAFAQDFV